MLRTQFDATSTQLLLKSLNDACVHLTDPAFAQVQRRADLFHRHLFVIVEDDDETFVAV